MALHKLHIITLFDCLGPLSILFPMICFIYSKMLIGKVVSQMNTSKDLPKDYHSCLDDTLRGLKPVTLSKKPLEPNTISFHRL